LNLLHGAGPSPATAQAGFLPPLALGCAGILAGSIAAVSGFGIGSRLTPVLALQVGTAASDPRLEPSTGGGNQGGIRTAAMLGYDVPKESFVATATAIALFVDAACLPVYRITQGREIARGWTYLLIAAGAVVVGTVLGQHILGRLSQTVFRRVVAVLLLGLGIYMLLCGSSR
jgi:hypothetical protein